MRLVKLKPILLILILAFAVRMVDINSPVVSWREADTAAMARNFYENRYNILYPQIDWGGTTSGYVESEFPIYQFLVATLYQLFGVHEVLARLLSALLATGSVYFVFALARALMHRSAALWSAAFFAFLPMQIFYGRMVWPEPLMIFGLTAGVYFFYRWYMKKKLAFILASSAFIAIACLIKPPVLYILLPFFYLAWLRFRGRLLLEPQIWLFLSLIIVPLTGWYYHAHQLHNETGLTFGIWAYGADKWGNWELVGTVQFWMTVFVGHLGPQLAVFGAALLYFGLVIKRSTREEYMLDLWLIALLVYVIIVAKGNYAHEYYLAPAIIPISLIMGKLYGRYLSKFSFRSMNLTQMALLVGIVAMLIPAGVIYLTRVENERSDPRPALAETIQTGSKVDDLIVTVDNGAPTLLYLSHRKGWITTGSDVEKKYPGAGYYAGFYNGEPFFSQAR